MFSSTAGRAIATWGMPIRRGWRRESVGTQEERQITVISPEPKKCNRDPLVFFNPTPVKFFYQGVIENKKSNFV